MPRRRTSGRPEAFALGGLLAAVAAGGVLYGILRARGVRVPILTTATGSKTATGPGRGVPVGPAEQERREVPEAKLDQALAEAWPNLSRDNAQEIVRVARDIGANPGALANLIAFESAGTFNPGIQNSINATGLIQFTPRTASRMGTTVDRLKRMSFREQMGEVKRYLQLTAAGQHWDSPGVSGGYDTEQALLMAVFFPPYRFVSPNTRFPQWAIDANTYTINGRTVVIDTPGAYTARMQSFARSRGKWPVAWSRFGSA